jgi:hypothetical protein
MLFLGEDDYIHFRKVIDERLRYGLPASFHGYPTNFTPPNPADNNVQLLQEVDAGPINHRVEVFTIPGFFLDYLDFNIEEPIEPADWLTFPEQKLRTITGGEVYHDGIGLQSVRGRS